MSVTIKIQVNKMFIIINKRHVGPVTINNSYVSTYLVGTKGIRLY